ncbi:hypothetical protein MRB53_016476 [Persea americana]|uniref:Uncharacterized protein n=1 Tax=Persea americana TaxID=3435 RepID=A0ACC2M3L4_PERAE|nr:hypothetical protein MRB53_016476 [Persea americana]
MYSTLVVDNVVHFCNLDCQEIAALAKVNKKKQREISKREVGHRVEIAIAAVIEGERVVSVGPDGSHGGVAALRDDAAERPRVDQIPSEDYVLDENVGGFPTLFSGAGAGVGRRRR